jgi:hypothetical protein
MDGLGREKRKRKIALIVVVLVLAALALPSLFVPRPVPPIQLQAQVLASDIYSLADRVRRVPVEIALPHLARAGLRRFVDDLPMEEGVRERVLARIDSPDFVDELVPFLLSLKAMYLPGEGAKAESFDVHLRRLYGPADAIPGMEHSMFQWASPVAESEEASSGGVGMDGALVGQLLSFYDAIFLLGRPDSSALTERLSCDRADDPESLQETELRARPVLESLLGRLRDRMEPDSEMRDAVIRVLEDPERLETIGISVVQFIDQMTCKHYRIFATRVHREQRLKDFLLGELEKPMGGRLWRYLDQALNERRYGALVVVDGLQGHLVEALALGEPASRFLGEIARVQALGAEGVAPDVVGKDAPAQQTSFLEAIAADGYRDRGYLPFFRALYDDVETDGLSSAAIAESGISTTPTISVRNLPVVFTGAPVAGPESIGIPNFHFVDRSFTREGVQQGRAYYFFGNDALELSPLTAQSGMKSLFERLSDRSSYACAAQYDEFAHAGIDPFFNLALGEAFRDFGEMLCFGELERRSASTRALRGLHESLLVLRPTLGAAQRWWDWYGNWTRRAERRRAEQLVKEISQLETESLPELLIWYDPWPDHFAHFNGPFADEIIAPSGELARLDYWLSKLVALYGDAGVRERTLFGMAGDHGLAPVFRLVSPEALVLDALQAEGVPIRVVKISSDEGEGPKLTNALRPPSMRGYDVVVASTAGGNLMLDLFIDQAERWDQQPLEDDVRRWRPMAWLEDDRQSGLDMIGEIVDRLGSSLDYLAVRTEPCGPESAGVRIIGPRGSALILRRGDRILYRRAPTPGTAGPLEIATENPYRAFSDADRSLQRVAIERCIEGPDAEDPTSWCTETEWRQLLRRTPRPDSVVQLAHLYDLDRAGTVNLFPAAGVAFNSIVPGRHAGESFHEKDGFAGLWGQPITRDASDGRIESALGGSVPMAIYEHLTNEPITKGTPGWGSPSLWHEMYPREREP